MTRLVSRLKHVISRTQRAIIYIIYTLFVYTMTYIYLDGWKKNKIFLLLLLGIVTYMYNIISNLSRQFHRNQSSLRVTLIN